MKYGLILQEYLSKHPLSYSARYMTELVFKYIEQFGELNPGNVESFRVRLLEKVSKVSANSYVKSVKPVFNWAYQAGKINENPFEKVKLYRVKKPEIIIFEPTEIQSILHKLNQKNKIGLRAAVMLGLTAALRLGEVLNLTVGDIDFENGKIWVRTKKRTPKTWYWQPKNGNNRQVPLTQNAEQVLTEVLLQNEGHPYLFLTAERYNDLISRRYINEQQSKKPTDIMSRRFTKLCHSCGIFGKTFHDLRRTCITNWAESLQIQETMILAGHSSPDTTLQFYVYVNKQKCLDRARLIGATGLEPATS